MSECLLPILEEEWKKPTVSAPERSLITPLGLVEGDVLLYLEAYGSTTLRQLIRELEWPTSLVTMAVGALVREGLIRAVQHELEVFVQPVAARPKARCA